MRLIVMPNEVADMEQTLLFNLLRATSQNQEIYPILQQNLDKLNDGFALLLRQWASNQFVAKPAQAIKIARIIVQFSQLIQQFEQGNPASNLEIAIAGYEAVLQVCTREAFPQDWSNIQQALVAAYQQRQQILSRTIAECRHNTIQTQTQINTLTEQFQQELQQAQQVDDLRNQQLLQQLQQTRQEVDELKTALTRLEKTDSNPLPQINLQPLVSAIKEIKSTHERFNTVILYDIENLTQGSRNPVFNFSLRNIIEQVNQINQVDKIAIQCAYADWSNNKLSSIKRDVQELGIEPIQIFGFSFQRNAADIQLAIDAIELAHSRPSLQVFVIVSGDGAFASLAKKLHEYGKTVIGCAYRKQTNRVLEAVCDRFIWLPDPEAESRDKTIHLVRATATDLEARITDYQKVLDYLKTNEPYCSKLRQNGINLQEVKQVFTQLIPGFNHGQQGFATFKDYLNSVCLGTEFEIVFHNGDKTRSMLKLKETSAKLVISHIAVG